MCIKGSSADDAGWRAIRAGQLAKMARGNFVRCNKAFMAAGVECRLPYMERSLVEGVMAMSKEECPPGKKLLKAEALEAGLPEWIVRRTKETFQGGAGTDEVAASVIGNPASFYRAEVGRAYGPSALARAA
jgi:asparagine synthase (glutamine-hydrolysing)